MNNVFKSEQAKKLIIAVLVLILAGGILFFVYYSKKSEPKSCTLEAKICPDGTSVGRSGPNCEFAKCSAGLSNFNSSQLEKAITEYLLTKENFSWQTEEGSFNFCSIENLRPGEELFPIYIWAYCGEYKIEDGELKTLSGTSLPIKIDYPNELSFYNLGKFSYEAPGDGSQNSKDIKRIFPADAQKMISGLDKSKIIERNEAIAFDNILIWESIKKAILNCEAEKVFQTHSKLVTLKLKSGEELSAQEPNIDEVMKISKEAENKCGRIIVGTE
ncbi:MAG: hypothetical protein WC435_03840 [Candidatus Paceibacterota bacterium]